MGRGSQLMRPAMRVLPGRSPDWIIVGAQKAGTTTLHVALHRSPDASPWARKEIHYFTTNWDRPLSWYRSQFLALPGRKVGEASPYYLFHPEALSRIAATVPDARLVVLLRDPVDRAYSHWAHNVRRGREDLGFVEAIEAEEDRLAGSDPDDPDAAYRHASYVARGMYADQLARVRAHFPAEQVRVVRSEDLYGEPDRTVAGVSRWLGLRPPPDVHRHNTGSPRAPLDRSVRRRLQARFAEDQRRMRAQGDMSWF